MIPNLYLGNGCFTKHPFKANCLEFQEEIIQAWIMNSCLLFLGKRCESKISHGPTFRWDIRSHEVRREKTVWSFWFVLGFFSLHIRTGMRATCPWLRSKIPLSIILFLQPVQARKGSVFATSNEKSKVLRYPLKIVMKQLEVHDSVTPKFIEPRL